ncbi:class I SAM-dependent methyltransferase [Salinisphaera hydrothermalis]|uniref:Group 1 glycosyl transferase n=1 Tax=Salinisphaera hydrothermalis (strain C41B8) TaxID=1304275 RepID=A0A084IQQ5_SALHC|nr:class I SAM-dependent methyltransferase [Salinisphaera hydrothermalis]KEZ79039.1 group 1 glycosyl transferase [Salinisphaera hydrothermalis C41B8]
MKAPLPADGSRFTGDWLSLREAMDHRSRAHGLAGFAAHYLAARCGPRRARVIDLGAGSGSNLRYLKPRLGGRIDWHLLDQDRDLLNAAVRDAPKGAEDDDHHIAAEVFDLRGPLAPRLAGADLVTASALLDLVSADWVSRFIDACATARAAVLIAVSIDGRLEFTDVDPSDALVRRALARDQARDKGLGPALGAAAPGVLIDALTRRGYAITVQPSDWHIDATDAELARALITGWRDAAISQCPAEAGRIRGWAEQRIDGIVTGASALRVGHVDILGLPGREPLG